jgi:hypothetical protein
MLREVTHTGTELFVSLVLLERSFDLKTDGILVLHSVRHRDNSAEREHQNVVFSISPTL